MPRKDNSLLKTLFSKENAKNKERTNIDSIKPMEYNLITLNESGYRILTKDKYVEWCLGRKGKGAGEATVKFLEENWDKIRKGYEFVVLIGDTVLNVEYFNNVVLGGNKKEEESHAMKINSDDMKIRGQLVVEGVIWCCECMKRKCRENTTRRCKQECCGSSAGVE